jgi:DNA-binding NarL/FixJ family response regulator
MKERIKFLSIGNKKLKSEEAKNWSKLIERYAPDMYDIINVAGEEEAINQVVQLRPEIIMISTKMKNALGLLIKIKQIHPTAVVFIMLGMVDDEQEAIDEFKVHGAYKCYTVPLVMDTLVHDMYVALNME